MQTQGKKKPVAFKSDSFLEVLNSVPSSVGSTTVSEMGKIGADIVTSLLGGTPMSGELKPNQTIELGGAPKPERTPEPVIHAPRMETVHRPNTSELDRETRTQIDAIRKELQALAKSLKGLHQEIQTAINEEPVDPGIYHVNFYEQIRSFLSVLRQQIEDSRSWLSTFNRRKKKMGYWGMYKKHGTSFGLSNERTLATSAG